jgi:hypothetical protein
MICATKLIPMITTCVITKHVSTTITIDVFPCEFCSGMVAETAFDKIFGVSKCRRLVGLPYIQLEPVLTGSIITNDLMFSITIDICPCSLCTTMATPATQPVLRCTKFAFAR